MGRLGYGEPMADTVEYYVVMLRETGGISPAGYGRYVPASEFPAGADYDIDNRVQYTPSQQPFVVFRKVTDR